MQVFCITSFLFIVFGLFVRQTPSTTTELHLNQSIQTVDLIVFSYDRPLQLYAFLESVEHYITGLESVTVIYRTSNQEFTQAYGLVQQAFNHVLFKQESSERDFKNLLIASFMSGQSPYILFAVDDMIAKNSADLTLCTRLLEQTQAYGFFLRLGTNLSYCYPLSCEQPVPPLTHVSSSVYCWKFKEGTCDWNYPNTVDMTIYRKKDILAAVEKLNYHNPNTFDVAWSKIAHAVVARQGLCFADSIIINIPMNRVQHEHNNRYEHTWTSAQLLTLFKSNLKIDISQFDGIKNNACHMPYEVSFVQRHVLNSVPT